MNWCVSAVKMSIVKGLAANILIVLLVLSGLPYWRLLCTKLKYQSEL